MYSRRANTEINLRQKNEIKKQAACVKVIEWSDKIEDFNCERSRKCNFEQPWSETKCHRKQKRLEKLKIVFVSLSTGWKQQTEIWKIEVNIKFANIRLVISRSLFDCINYRVAIVNVEETINGESSPCSRRRTKMGTFKRTIPNEKRN